MLNYIHGNKAGSGSCMTVEVCMNSTGENGLISIVMYPQKNRFHPEQEWRGAEFYDKGIEIFLDVNDVAHVINVLEGNAVSILNGKGVRVKNDEGMTVLHVDMVTKPYNGFAFHISYEPVNGMKDDVRIILNQTESLALLKSLEGAMATIAFGI